MTDPVQTWHLHIGAHKTATTHLQQMLNTLRPDLEAAEIGVATIDQLRAVRALDLRIRRPKAWLSGAPLRHEIEARLTQKVALKPRMVLSEEDILGYAAAPIEPKLYPRAGFRVRALTRALLTKGQGQGGIWMSVRSFDRFMPAAYATALKHGPLTLTSAALRDRVLTRPPDWAELVGRLRRAAPEVPITVWNYEDYRANTAAILSDLTGLRFDTLPKVADPPDTQTPDDAAIRAAEALPAERDTRARAATVGRIYEAATGPRFSLFSAAEAAELQSLHRRQLDAVSALPGIRMLTF